MGFREMMTICEVFVYRKCVCASLYDAMIVLRYLKNGN